MKRIISWLQANLSRSKSVFPPVNPANTTPEKDDLDLTKDMQDSMNDAPKPDTNESTNGIVSGDAKVNLADDQELAEKVFKPDEYSDDYDTTVLDLEDVDPDASDADKSTEFDPYDTGVLQKK